MLRVCVSVSLHEGETERMCMPVDVDTGCAHMSMQAHGRATDPPPFALDHPVLPLTRAHLCKIELFKFRAHST